MSYLSRQHWAPGGDGLTRADRRGCAYDAYVPDPLAERSFTFAGEVAADIADAEAAIVRLNAQAVALVDTEAIARLLLRAEAVASSRIEGLALGPRRLLREESARRTGADGRGDVTAREVLGNIDAMAEALAAAETGDAISVDTILGIHRRLLAGTRLEAFGGMVREAQNWIGGSEYNPCAADFIPPPPSEVMRLLGDLAAFCNDDSLPAVAQAAVVHAQFETIHPFADGNGRTGRALIHLILRRRGLAPRVLPPVSLVLATRAREYVEALTSFRYVGDAGSSEAEAGLNAWVALFAGSCARSVADAAAFEERVRAIQRTWRERLGTVRRGSSVDRLIDVLPGSPVVTVSDAAELLGRSFRAANSAVEELTRAGVLVQIGTGSRNRRFEAREIVDAFADLERSLSVP